MNQQKAAKRGYYRDSDQEQRRELVDEVLSDAHSAITTKQRIAVLSHIDRLLSASAGGSQVNNGEDYTYPLGTEAAAICRHLIEGGILSALVLQLNFVLQRHGTTVKEIDQLFSTIHVLTRSCPGEVRSMVSAQIENPQFLDLVSRAVKHQPITMNVACLLHTVSGTATGSLALLKCRNLLLQLIDTLAIMDGQEDSSPEWLLLECLGCLKNITCFAEDERSLLLCFPEFCSTLASICHQRPLVSKAAERVSAIFRNLMLSPDCRRTLQRDSVFVNALFELASVQQNHRVLRNILNVLHSLALESGESLLLVMHGDGAFLSVLRRLLDDDDNVVRRRSARTFRLLTNEASAPLLVHRQDVMSALSRRAVQDENQAVRNEAAEAFSKCAGLVHADEPHHRTILQALVRLSKSPGMSPEILGRALREQASHPENRIAMGGDKELVRLVSHIAGSSGASLHAREDACCALRDMSEEETNRKVLGGDDCVLGSLVLNAQAPSYEPSRRRTCAVQALVLLSDEPANRISMVKHDKLLKALIQFASAADAESSDIKHQVKQTILTLVKVL